MELPLCYRGQCVGTLTVRQTEDGGDFAACGHVAQGLYRLYLQGEEGELLLGVTENGALRRRFSSAFLAPVGTPLRGVLRQGGEAPLPPLPKGAAVQKGAVTEVTIPWREGEPFPLTQLFCFARVGREGVHYLFDGQGRPLMPKI